jgi:hypothetical protein
MAFMARSSAADHRDPSSGAFRIAGKITSMRAGIVILLALLLASVQLPTLAAEQTRWCILDPPEASRPIPLYDHVYAAELKLCAGDYQGARAALAALAPQMMAEGPDGSHLIDFQRAYFYALIASGDSATARHFLTSFEYGWKPEKADRLYWNGDYLAALAAYIDDDSKVQRMPDNQAQHKLDPNLPIALAMLKANNLDGAITAMKNVHGDDSLYPLMLGNLYAEKRDWSAAFDAWTSAADTGPDMIEMEFSAFDTWNFTAMEMIYYYRAHIPK